MIEQLIDEDIIIPITAIVCTFLWLIIATLSSSVKGMFSIWRNTRLKERMLERGLSVDDIQRVMAAGKKNSCTTKTKQGVKPVSAQAYDV